MGIGSTLGFGFYPVSEETKIFMHVGLDSLGYWFGPNKNGFFAAHYIYVLMFKVSFPFSFSFLFFLSSPLSMPEPATPRKRKRKRERKSENKERIRRSAWIFFWIEASKEWIFLHVFFIKTTSFYA